MSGICGILSFDGGDPDLAPVLALLERRGPDGTNRWHDGAVALGHTLLATTPEALVEVLPLTEPDSGCTITADARLDNREELIAALGFGGETRTLGDGELILRAYLEWGEECPKHLLGDFAFAIWDPREQRLFCARDHMGMRHFNYCHIPRQLFVFATEPDALVAHDRVPLRINEGRIADFLDDLEGIDFTSTFYQKVFRLPPAHTLIIDEQVLKLRRYWELVPGPKLKLDSDEAYAKAFLEVFTKAVSCRLRSCGPVGSMLSGGIDSNAVTAVASSLIENLGIASLKTYSAIASDPANCVETESVHCSVAFGSYRSTLIDLEKLDDFQPKLIRLLQTNREPFDGQMSMIRAVYLHAKVEGVKIVLDGVSADVVLMGGNGVARLMQKGKVVRAWREAKHRELFWGKPENALRIMLDASWVTFVPRPIRAFRQRARAAWFDLRLNRNHELVSKEFAQAVGLPARRQMHRGPTAARPILDSLDRAHIFAQPWFVAGRERYDRVASAVGIEPRDPFLDIRVIAFCLSLPPEQLEYDGWPKIILRRAMSGRVSDRVAWRRGKEHLGLTFTNILIDSWGGWQIAMKNQTSAIRRFVNPQALPDLGVATTMDISIRNKLIMLALWLESH